MEHLEDGSVEGSTYDSAEEATAVLVALPDGEYAMGDLMKTSQEAASAGLALIAEHIPSPPQGHDSQHDVSECQWRGRAQAEA